MNNIIVGKNLTKKYKDIMAVDNIDINIDRGVFYAIMGPSGSGKTTLLNILGILDDPSSGRLHVDNKEVAKLSDKEKSIIRMKDFGFVFQQFYLNSKLKAYENVMIPMYINPKYKNENLKEKSIELLELLGLKERQEHFPSEMSGGEQQRVAIARALANNPQCIFADEPTGNLDEESEKVVFDYLKLLTKQGKAVIVVSHNNIVLEYADKVYHMRHGKLKEEEHEA